MSSFFPRRKGAWQALDMGNRGSCKSLPPKAVGIWLDATPSRAQGSLEDLPVKWRRFIPKRRGSQFPPCHSQGTWCHGPSSPGETGLGGQTLAVGGCVWMEAQG